MLNLLAACGFFLLIHVAVSGTRARDVLVARLGQGPYTGLFVLASFVGLGWMGWAYAGVRSDGPVWWGVTEATRGLQLVLGFVAFQLIVVGLATPNPTSVRQEGAVERPARGIVRITRHPFLWGVALWAAGHLLVNGDLPSFVLFGSLLVLAMWGTVLIDGKRRRALGHAWEAFAAQTSAVPFAAVLAGRQSLPAALREMGWRPLLGAVVWAAVTLAHPWLFGVTALPT